MKYILVFRIDDYCEMGGGIEVRDYEDPKLLDQKAEEVIIAGHEIIFAGELKEYTYKTIEVATKVVRED